MALKKGKTVKKLPIILLTIWLGMVIGILSDHEKTEIEQREVTEIEE
jgi:hypothetical protein